MKIVIEEYGHLIVLFLVGSILLIFVGTGFWQQMRERTDLPDSVEKTGNEHSTFFRIPEFQGLEQDGKPLALKIPAGSAFHPLHTEHVIEVTAVDPQDGDITDRILVYLIYTEGEKEKRVLLEGELEAEEPNKQYILEYTVRNSAGFQAEKRISLLTDGTGG